MTSIEDIIATYWKDILIIIASVFAIYFGWKDHKYKRDELIPHCILRPLARLRDLYKPRSQEKSGETMLINKIYIQRTGGVITYPKFHYILTYKTTDELKHGTLEYTQMTTLLDRSRGGPWSFQIIMPKEQSKNIESLYLVLECKDQGEKDYITINKFDFVNEMWQVKRSIVKTKRKGYRIKRNIEMFVNNPRDWIITYGDRGKPV